MDIRALKLELVFRIIKTNKPSVLIEIDRMLQKENTSDWWDELPQEVKESVLEGMKDIEIGNIHEHDQVVQEVRQKYGF